MKIIFSVLIMSVIWAPATFAQLSLLQQAEQYFEQEEYEEVVTLLEESPPDGSPEDSLLVFLGKSHLELTNYDSAIEVFTSLVRLEEGNAEYHYLLGQANMQTLMNTSNFFKKGRYADGVKTALNRSLEIQPSHVAARTLLSNYYLNAPMLAGGSTRKAMEHAEILKSFAPIDGGVLLASIYNQEEEYEKARDVYHQMMESGIEYEKIYYKLSVISFNEGEYQESLEYTKQSIREYPEYLTAYYQYGKTAVFLEENRDQAIGHLKHYVEHEKEPGQPGDHWAYLRLGQLYRQKGLTDDAREAFASSIAVKPDFEQALAELEDL